MTKRDLRRSIRDARAAQPAAVRAAAAESLTARLVALTERLGASRVAGYFSTPDEPSTHGFLAWADGAGVRVLLSAARADRGLDWIEHVPGAPAVPGLHGIPVHGGPVVDAAAIGDVGLLLVPAAAVDVTGMRLGWGLGYYDRFLAAAPTRAPVYGLVFDSEFVAVVPHESHDHPVDGVLTPGRTIDLSHR